MAKKEKRKHYLLAEGIIKQDAKNYGIPKEDVPSLVKSMARQILKSLNKNEFVLVKVKL